MEIICTRRDWDAFCKAVKHANPQISGEIPPPKEFPCGVLHLLVGNQLVTGFFTLNNAWNLIKAFAAHVGSVVQPDEVAFASRLDNRLFAANQMAMLSLLDAQGLLGEDGMKGFFKQALHHQRLIDEAMTAANDHSELPTREHKLAYRLCQQLGMLPEPKENPNGSEEPPPQEPEGELGFDSP